MRSSLDTRENIGVKYYWNTNPESYLRNSKIDAHNLVALEKNPKIQDFQPGDNVRVSILVTEGDRKRTQIFEGVVIRKRGSGPGSSFSVRRVAHNIGVERTFLIHSPTVEEVKIVRRGKVRRARLNYLRGLSGKQSRITERR